MPEPTQRNNCGVVTIYEMIVTCLPTNPSTPDGQDGSINLNIFGGTPPYDIEWTDLQIYDQQINNLSVDKYTATVTDSTGDYTQTITCELTPPGTTPTTTVPPTTIIPLYEFCLKYNTTNIFLIPNGTLNGKNKWVSDPGGYSVYWDNTKWKLTGTTIPSNVQIINMNPNYPPINSSWQVLGGNGGTAIANNGPCGSTSTLSLKLTPKNPTCTCNGQITASATGGLPGYTYSKDGVNYVSTPIFNNLCGGVTQNIFVKDSNGVISSESVSLLSPTQPIVYSISLGSASVVTTGNNSKKSTFILSVNPSLPPGTKITFDLTLNGSFLVTPNQTNGSSTFVPSVKKNGSDMSNTDNTSNSTGTSTLAGCQQTPTFSKNYSFKYGGLEITNTDTYLISVDTSYAVNCNGAGNCCNASFKTIPSGSLSNVKINGCQCCTVSQ